MGRRYMKIMTTTAKPKTLCDKSGLVSVSAITQLVSWMNEATNSNNYSQYLEYGVAHTDGRVFFCYNGSLQPEIERIEKGINA